MTVRGIVRYARSGLLRAMPERHRGRGDSQGMQGAYFLAPRAPMSARTQRSLPVKLIERQDEPRTSSQALCSPDRLSVQVWGGDVHDARVRLPDDGAGAL